MTTFERSAVETPTVEIPTVAGDGIPHDRVEPNRRVRRVQNLLMVALLLVYAVLGWRGRTPLAIGSGDELTYLALSHSIEAGSYREIFQASAPLHRQYPPGYPLWLILVRHATGERLDLIPAVNVVLVVISLAMLTIVARRIAGGWTALAGLLVLVLNQAVLWMGGSYYSEALFLFLSTCALVATRRASARSSRWAYAAIVFALLAFMTRSIGVAVVAAVGAWLLSRRRRSELAAYAAVWLVVILPWFWYSAFTPPAPTIRTYAREFTSDQPIRHTNIIVQVARRARSNAVDYATGTLPSELSLPTIEGTSIDNVLWLALMIVCLGAGLVLLWRAWSATAAYLAAYAAILLVWVWPVGRFLSPVLPLIVLCFLVGGKWLAGRLPSWAGAPASYGVVALLTFGSATGALKRLALVSDCDRSAPYTSPGCYPPETRSMVSAAEYVRQHAEAGDVVLAAQPSSIAFLSGHLSESAQLIAALPAGGIPGALRDQRIRYVLLTSMKQFERGVMLRALLASCTELRVEARFPEGSLLLRVAEPGEGTTDACDDLREYRRENIKKYGYET